MGPHSEIGPASLFRARELLLPALGAAFFAQVAAVHLVLASGSGSVPLLGVLWAFVGTPVVYIWWWRYGRRARHAALNLIPRVYLSLGVVLPVVVLLGVGWIASERGISPEGCDIGRLSLEHYPDLHPLAEEVTFPSPQGGKLVGWFIPGESPATVILLHGFSCQRHEMLEHAQILHHAGYTTLLFDFGGRGESDGVVTLGFYEQQDVLSAVEYLKTRDDVDMDNLGVLGASMGAAAAILAAAQAPEIKAVIADSPFESAERAIEEGFTRVVGLPAFPFAPVTLKIIELRVGVSPTQVVPRERVAAISPRPLLLIHGTADTQVTPVNSEILYAAAGEPKELRLLPDLQHTRGIWDLREEYALLIVEFFHRHLDRGR
jgi:uncharacterized protein